ncbi:MULTISPECIES: DUF1992 domain-containing protein [Pantoea]|uniref:DnaJ homologue subfamily C member 28 conserved domain-containing protein n=1 Tax=Pantoea stewartii TaxID=66269 RepID=A0AB34VE50_9GAMM|nr:MULTISPECIES: DUF1992 domain-containing protein [Pantoea]KTS75484.1 hypothetical protein RSA30_02925 [Pantoea stewartii]KTS95430.1 hypothetical protein RSA13_15935 [Pantoea stewartii]KTT09697.1 hypothetical protein RSA36_01685 [Pantoea stewartii]MCU7367025.1 DUF1992 domain-containing protein [Pantoea stewartii]WRH11545.1 DUF1992 domain-containing protein [Pantoea sp. JZ2]
MWLVDQLAEQHIKAAQEKGELSDLPGEGAPLNLEDDSQVPPELRAGYRLLKNAGFLPPELELRREALQVSDLLQHLDPDDPEALIQTQRLRQLKIRLSQAGMRTDFLEGEYGRAIKTKLVPD